MKKECYTHNCTGCGRLHIWSMKTVKVYGMKYQCMECLTVNELKESDLM